MSARQPFCTGPCAGGARPCPARQACAISGPPVSAGHRRIRIMAGTLVLLVGLLMVVGLVEFATWLSIRAAGS